MTEAQKSLPTWILIVSGVFALLELTVSVSLYVSPESVVDTVNLNAKGVDYLIYMWAGWQFALGFIFAFATFKKSNSDADNRVYFLFSNVCWRLGCRNFAKEQLTSLGL